MSFLRHFCFRQSLKIDRKHEGEGEGVGDGEGGGEQEEEDEEEAGDERGGLDGQEVLHALGQEAQLRQVGEGDVAVVVQKRGEVGQVQGEGEEGARAGLALEPLLARRQQQGSLLDRKSVV